MNAVVLSFDQLALRLLSSYGNEWIETPSFDRLAAGAVVFEQHFGENFDSAAVNHAWWTGCYQFPRTAEQQRRLAPFTETLRTAGVQTCLVVEKSAVESTGQLPQFDQVLEVGWLGSNATTLRAVPGPQAAPPWGRFAPPQPPAAAGPAEAPFAQLVSRGIQCLNELCSLKNGSWLLWLKSGGVSSPASRVQSPETDEEFRSSSAEAVTAIDRCLGQLLDAVEPNSAEDDLLLIVTASSGDSLGARSVAELARAQTVSHLTSAESLRIQRPLREELVHTPLFVRCSQGEMGTRRQTLVQTVDLVPTLLEWFQCGRAPTGRESGWSAPRAEVQLAERTTLRAVPDHNALEGRSLLPLIRDEPTEWRDCAFLGDGLGACGIRTAERYFVQRADDSAPGEEGKRCLYVKPDDVWDVHNVADQSPEDVDELDSKLEAFLSRYRDHIV